MRLLAVLATALLGLAPLGVAHAQQTAILDVSANVDGALVYLDGALLGVAPLSELIAPGRHTLRIERPGHEPFEQPIAVGVDGLAEIKAQLIRNAPGIVVHTGVEDARVLVDGVQVGVGDQVILDPAALGRHHVVAESDAHGSREIDVVLRDPKLEQVDLPLVTPKGTLVVQSEPSGAHVFVDGVDRGLTPLTLGEMDVGGVGVRVELEGYSGLLQATSVVAGKSVTVVAALSREGGTLEVRPTVRTAKVLVNGVDVGVGKQVVGPLRPGMYSVRVSAPGYADFVGPVDIEPNVKAVVQARLESFDGGRVATRTGVPVTKRPGFWVGVGAGAAAVVGGVVAAVAIANADPGDPGDPVVGVAPPASTYRFVLP